MNSRGYTLIEVLVVAGIAVLLGSLMLANPGSGNRTSDVQRAAQLLSVDLRRAQAFAVSAEEEPQCSDNVVPYYGVRVLEQDGQEGIYEFFADCDRNNEYNGNKDVILAQETLPNVEIQNTTPSHPSGWLEVVYQPPNPTVIIRRQESNAIFSIELRHLKDQDVIRRVEGNNKGNVEITE